MRTVFITACWLPVFVITLLSQAALADETVAVPAPPAGVSAPLTPARDQPQPAASAVPAAPSPQPLAAPAAPPAGSNGTCLPAVEGSAATARPDGAISFTLRGSTNGASDPNVVQCGDSGIIGIRGAPVLVRVEIVAPARNAASLVIADQNGTVLTREQCAGTSPAGGAAHVCVLWPVGGKIVQRLLVSDADSPGVPLAALDALQLGNLRLASVTCNAGCSPTAVDARVAWKLPSLRGEAADVARSLVIGRLVLSQTAATASGLQVESPANDSFRLGVAGGTAATLDLTNDRTAIGLRFDVQLPSGHGASLPGTLALSRDAVTAALSTTPNIPSFTVGDITFGNPKFGLALAPDNTLDVTISATGFRFQGFTAALKGGLLRFGNSPGFACLPDGSGGAIQTDKVSFKLASVTISAAGTGRLACDVAQTQFFLDANVTVPSVDRGPTTIALPLRVDRSGIAFDGAANPDAFATLRRALATVLSIGPVSVGIDVPQLQRSGVALVGSIQPIVTLKTGSSEQTLRTGLVQLASGNDLQTSLCSAAPLQPGPPTTLAFGANGARLQDLVVAPFCRDKVLLGFQVATGTLSLGAAAPLRLPCFNVKLRDEPGVAPCAPKDTFGLPVPATTFALPGGNNGLTDVVVAFSVDKTNGLTLAVSGTVTLQLLGNQLTANLAGLKFGLNDRFRPLVQDVPLEIAVSNRQQSGPVKLGLFTASGCPKYVVGKRGSLSIADPKQDGSLQLSYKLCGAIGLPRFFAVNRKVQLFDIKPDETPPTDPTTGSQVTDPNDPASDGLVLVFDNLAFGSSGLNTREADFFILPNNAGSLDDKLFQLTSGRLRTTTSSCKKDDPNGWIFIPFAKVCFSRLDIAGRSADTKETEIEISGAIQPLRVIAAPDLIGDFDAAYMPAGTGHGARFHLHADFSGAQIKSGDETITVSSFDIDHQDTRRSINAEVSLSSQALKGATVYVRRLGFEETRATADDVHWHGRPIFAIDKGKTTTSFGFTFLTNVATLLFAHFVSPIKL